MLPAHATFAVALLLLPALPARAQEGEGPLLREMFLADSLHLQRGGDVQLSWSLYRHRQEGVKLTEVPLQLEIGISDAFQVHARLPWVRRRPPGADAATGLGDLEVGFMVGALRDPGGLLVSTGVDVRFSTAARRVASGPENTVVEPFMAIGHALGRGEFQLRLASPVEEPARAFYDVSAVYPVGSFRAVLEVNGEVGPDRPALRVTPGLVFKPGNRFEMGVAAPLGVTSGIPPSSLLVRVTSAF